MRLLPLLLSCATALTVPCSRSGQVKERRGREGITDQSLVHAQLLELLRLQEAIYPGLPRSDLLHEPIHRAEVSHHRVREARQQRPFLPDDSYSTSRVSRPRLAHTH